VLASGLGCSVSALQRVACLWVTSYAQAVLTSSEQGTAAIVLWQ
jgi:hypothetical protein